MTSLRRIELTCPVCLKPFHSRALLAAAVSLRRRTDFHEERAGVERLPYLIHSCWRCGYTGSDREFGSDVQIGPTIATSVWNRLAPKLSSGPIAGSDKYELAAKIAAWRGARAEQVAQLLLSAAWCCVDEDDVEAERFFRRDAAHMFETALVRSDGVAPERRALLTYLVGELWRRVGDLAAATEWFGRVRSEIIDPSHQRWIVDLAAQQRDDPREWLDDARSGNRVSRAARSFRRQLTAINHRSRGPSGG